MSLQIAAQHMASRGRGPDTQLMHMAPQEVAGLQALAKAHGGSLTTNPDTGLPEAGFLSSILPALIGGGLSIASGGALSPLMSAMMVGGGMGIASGNLRKGLTAGLGAYGGASLGAGLFDAGASAGAAAGAEPLGFASTELAAQPATLSGKFAQAGQGLKSLGNKDGLASFMGSAASKGVEATGMGGGMGLMKTGLMAAAPMLAAPVTQQPEIKSDADMGQRFKFSPGRVGPTPMPDTPGQGSTGQNFGRERNYFAPTYTPIGQEEAKNAYGFAAGGPVENMSNLNTVGANTGYPQADIAPRAYATPYQQPMPQNVVGGVQGAGINPYTGQEQFAEGGEVGADEYTFDPMTQTYTKKGGQGATTVKPPSMMAGPQGGNYNPGMNPQVESFLENETPAERDARMGKIDSFLSAVMPGAMATKALSGLFGESGAAAGQAQGVGTGMSYNDDYASPDSDGSGSTDNGDSGRDHGNSGSAPGGGAANGGLMALAGGGQAQYNLGGYSDGGRLLRGPGDGVSDSIPAMIGNKQPARLADGEFVVPARIVSELGNGSTEAGARKLYAMMDRVQKNRSKSVGKGKVAVNTRADKHLPA